MLNARLGVRRPADGPAIVVSDDARVRRRALRPVEEAVMDGNLLGRMVAGRQAGHELSDCAGLRIHLEDARGVARTLRAADALSRVRHEHAPAEIILEGDADRW